MKKFLFLLFAAAGFLTALKAEVQLNMLREDSFKPLTFLGRLSAARGWGMHDIGRDTYSKKDRLYVPGEDCFTLSYKDHAFFITMKKPLHDCYKIKGRNRIDLRGNVTAEYPPAPVYHIKGRLLAKNGRITLRGAYTLPKKNSWQTIDLKSKKPFRVIELTVGEGAVFGFAELTEVPEYPGEEGSIALPDNGSLDKILLAENATYEERISVMLWRGWLWKLTGKALPVEIVKEVKPTSNALVLMQGKEKSGRWSIKVDKNGILLTYGDPSDAYAGLFDYLRRGLGCAFYAEDCQKIPAQGSVKVLPAIDFTAKPVYNYFTPCNNMAVKQGAVDRDVVWTRNMVDYYHLFSTKSDHVFNLLLPQEVYFKTHPEYFCSDAGGQRYVAQRPYFTQQCLTNPEARKIAVRNAVEYVKLQSTESTGARRLVIDVADGMTHCLCPECVKFNNGTASCSNIVYDFHRQVAKILQKEYPQFIFERHSYASRVEPPDDMSPLPDNTNMYVTNVSCKLHSDCELNQSKYDRIKQLLPLVKNDISRFSFMGYSDYRPIYMLKFMKNFSRYGKDVFFLWHYKSPHPSNSFLLGRWNLGEDPEALLKEFEAAYFGKAAPFVHEAYVITENFAENYKHTKEEIDNKMITSIWPDSFGVYKTVLDRKVLDKIIACYEKALAAEPDDKVIRSHIYNDLKLYLVEDLNKFRPGSCKNDKELAAYAKRLQLLINAGRECPGKFDTIMHKTAAREYLNTVTGLEIPKTKKNWADEPIFDKVFADPGAYLNISGENFNGEGNYYNPEFFQTHFDFTFEVPPRVSDKVVPRSNLILNPAQVMSLEMNFKKTPQHNLMLAVEGLLEKAGNYTFELALNGKVFYSGKAKYRTDNWSRMGFSIPAELLKKGDNKLTIKNTSGNWIAVSEIYTVNPGDDLDNFAADRQTIWGFVSLSKFARGKISCQNGKAVISCKKDQNCGLGFFRNKHDHPKIAAAPGSLVTLKFKVKGSGSVIIGAFRYSPYEIDPKTNRQILKSTGYVKHIGNIGKRVSKRMRVSSEEQELTYTFKMPENGGMFFPFINVKGNSQVTISGFDCEIKP